MNDIINRQDAIDALNDEFTIMGKINAIVVQAYIQRVNNRLHDLPSAQSEIIRCKDCKWWEDDSYTLFQVIMGDDNHHHCISFDAYTKTDDYCSFAGRREDADKETGCD